MENIEIKICSEVSDEDIYLAFKEGFSDYIVKFDLSKDQFLERFFGAEGNKREHSHIAYDMNRPVGVVLGGIITYDDIRTFRCGTLSVVPTYRKKGVGRQLMKRHEEIGRKNRCQMMMLEVISGNDRAVDFYEKLGYEKAYFLRYYTLKELRKFPDRTLDVEKIRPEMIKRIKPILNETHINWQNSLDYTDKLEGIEYYGITSRSNLSSFIIFDQMGKIYRMWTHPGHRREGHGVALLHKVIEVTGKQELHMSVSSNAGISNFLRRFGFQKDNLYQFEMIKPII
ncbi:GNAT family N-acetyltransferase [Gudongella sp. SC589]|jgi:ribosomal protein S18 acetylase RimI-like enzyme|uniref:GNAT family N-acetyltransferase n=1 Tax=Gudongella sp. SC589 TaxID=3385990 RepID=UPI0039048237